MTPIKIDLLRSLHSFRLENGYGASVRDLQSMCGISSTSVVNYHLKHLLEAGYINRVPLLARSITLTEKGRESIGDTDGNQLCTDEQENTTE